jgi:predicted Rossmann-fold nucleotide-binding protein
MINFETLVEFGTISPEDLNLLHLSDKVEDAFQFITSNLKVER